MANNLAAALRALPRATVRLLLAVGAAALPTIAGTSAAAAAPASAPASASAASASSVARAPAAKAGRPAWSELTRSQRELLAPLASNWQQMSEVNRRKWLRIASRAQNLGPAEQARLQERMTEWVQMTPEQRRLARENFQIHRSVPTERKAQAWDRYQQLPEDRKRELAKAEPLPRSGAVTALPSARNPAAARPAAGKPAGDAERHPEPAHAAGVASGMATGAGTAAGAAASDASAPAAPASSASSAEAAAASAPWIAASTPAAVDAAAVPSSSPAASAPMPAPDAASAAQAPADGSSASTAAAR